MKKIIILCLIALLPSVVFAQSESVTGRVVDDKGVEIMGATVIISGTTSGVVTDLNGAFVLNVEKGDILEVSFIGYEPAQQLIGKATNYTVVLKESSLAMDEVIVTGYSKERKSDIAGAVAVVDMDAITQDPSSNILTAMQGRVPGLQINSGGTPGGNDTQITIRGLTTVSSGSSPLWVIDGVQTFSPAALNPDEIESMQVLKDGASTALYGTSAANGVIVVTTKQGKEGVSKFNFSYETTVNFLRDNIKALDADGWLNVYYQARKNDGISGDFSVFKDNGKGFVKSEYLDENQMLRTSNTDWVNAITSTSVSHNADANYTYGTDKFSLFTGVNYNRDNGVQDYTYYQRINARVNTSYKLWNDKITIGENFMYSYFEEVQANEFSNAILQNPLIPIYAEDGSFSSPTIGDKPNSVANLWANRYNKSKNHRFLGNVYGNMDIVKGLVLSTSLNFDKSLYAFDTRTQPFMQMGAMPSSFNDIDVDNIDNNSLRTVWTNTLNYELVVKKHRFTALAGLEFTRQDDNYLTERIRGVDITTYPVYTVRADAEYQTIKNEIDYRKQSMFGMLKYVYDDRYVLTGTVRRDGSSRFGSNNRFATFPSASFAWNAKNESFMENVDFVSALKLRASWGINGNDIIGDYLYMNSYVNNQTGDVIEFADYDIDGDGIGTIEGVLKSRQANPDIKWEQTTQYNVGIDLSLLNNKINFSLDLFDKRTSDLILQPISLSVVGEAAAPVINAGEVSNKGYEMVISYNNQNYNGLHFQADANFSQYKNNVESLGDGQNFLLNNTMSITMPGYSIASFYGLVADGIFRTPEEVAVHADQSGADVGMIRYKDLNNDGVINDDDRTVIGNPHPDFTYGINLNFGYKGFNLGTYFEGKHGHDIYNLQRQLGDFTYYAYNYTENALDAWSPSNANSNIPMLSTINSGNQTQPSSYFVEDGSYFRLKSISFSYTFPSEMTKSIKLNNLKLYVNAQNVFEVTSFTGADYEVSGLSSAGIGLAGYSIPHTRTITLGVSTNF